MMNSAARKTDPKDGRRPFGTSSRMDRWNRGAWILRDQTLHALALAFAVPIVLIAWFVHCLIHRQAGHDGGLSPLGRPQLSN